MMYMHHLIKKIEENVVISRTCEGSNSNKRLTRADRNECPNTGHTLFQCNCSQINHLLTLCLGGGINGDELVGYWVH